MKAEMLGMWQEREDAIELLRVDPGNRYLLRSFQQ